MTDSNLEMNSKNPWWNQKPGEAELNLKTSTSSGLSSEEARLRLQSFGPNELLRLLGLSEQLRIQSDGMLHVQKRAPVRQFACHWNPCWALRKIYLLRMMSLDLLI